MMQVERELERLESEERALSARRRRLHERIDFLRAGGADDPGGADALAQLEQQEREVSAARRSLHRQIDELRIRLGRPAGPQPRLRLGA